ncbi:hypothetical protein BOX15_Mlig025434g2, partial [Macrostomum lignano]
EMQQSQSDAVAATLTSLRLLFACRRCLCACGGGSGVGGPAELLLDRLQEIFSAASDRLQRLADNSQQLRSRGGFGPGASAKKAAAGLVPPLCLKREMLHLLRRSMLRCGSGGSDRLLGDFGESLDRLLPDDFNDEFGEDELSAFSDTSCLSGDGGDSLAAQLAELRIGLDACLVVTSLMAERGSSCGRGGGGDCGGSACGGAGVCGCCLRWSARAADLEAEAAQLRAGRPGRSTTTAADPSRAVLADELRQLTDDLRRLVGVPTPSLVGSRRAMPLPPPPPPLPAQLPPPLPPRPCRRSSTSVRRQRAWVRDYTDV